MKPNDLIVLMPTRGTILTETQDALDREIIVNGLVPLIIRTHDIQLPISRNYLVESALKIPGWKYVLFSDEDVIMPKGGLKELIKLNCDVAILDYPMHTLQDGKGVGTMVTDKDKSIAWAGLGCTLVKREVFNKISQPWFVNTNHKIRRDNDGRIGFFAGQDGEMKFSGGEDVYFFLQCRKENLIIKSTKLIAQHAHLELVVSAVSNNRYQQTHKIVKRDKIEKELL